MSIQLQPSTGEDEVWLEELRRAVYLDLFVATWGAWDESRHQRHWASCKEKGCISIIKKDEIYIGMAQVFEEVESVEIAELQVLPEFQCRGVGTHVLSKIIEGAHARADRRPSQLAGRMTVRSDCIIVLDFCWWMRQTQNSTTSFHRLTNFTTIHTLEFE